MLTLEKISGIIVLNKIIQIRENNIMKKIICIGLTLALLPTALPFTVLAATSDGETAGAVMTLEERQAAGHQLLFFKFPSEWGNTADIKWNKFKHTVNILCSYYSLYGTEDAALQYDLWSSKWKGPSYMMMSDEKNSDIIYYDFTESSNGELEEGADYSVFFSYTPRADSDKDTCLLYLNTDCLGDTYMLDEPTVTRAKTYNCPESDYLAHSSNGIGQPLKKVRWDCTYLDGVFAGNAPRGLEIANALKNNLTDLYNERYFTPDKVAALFEPFETTAQDVYDAYVEMFGDRINAGTPYTHVDGVNDLKDDGTLRDCYRYVTDAEYPAIKYPVLKLVRERLGLTSAAEVIDTVAPVSLNNAVINSEEQIPVVTVPADDRYTVDAAWSSSDSAFACNSEYTLTVTYTAKENFCFEAVTGYGLTGCGEGTVPFVASTAYENGRFIVKYTFQTGDVFTVTGDNAEIFGDAWNDGIKANNMIFNAENGTYTKSFTVDRAYDNVQLKVVKNHGEAFGEKDGSNLTFRLTGSGTFTVVFKPETGSEPYSLEVTGDNAAFIKLPFSKMYIYGNGSGNWLNGANHVTDCADNEMTEIEENIWEITFENVPADVSGMIDYSFKFSADGSPETTFGSSPAWSRSIYWNSAYYFRFRYEGIFEKDIKIRLDLRKFNYATKEGGTYSVSIVDRRTSGDANGDGRVDVRDVTAIQRHIADNETLNGVDLANADVDGDGEVTIADATRLQRYLAEFDDMESAYLSGFPHLPQR